MIFRQTAMIAVILQRIPLLISFILCTLFSQPILSTALATVTTDIPNNVLRAYGPGGPHHVLQECADLFRQKHGVEVIVIKALPHDLKRKLPEDGDIYYGGAEYMLEEFNRENPGILDMNTVEKLYARQIGIIVRKGNPLNIKAVECLDREDVNLLDVKLERMRHFYEDSSGGLSNVNRLEYTGRQGLSAWLSTNTLDAWVTYKSWHAMIDKEADFIKIPGTGALRYTPVALTNRTNYRQEAMDFINFLKSEEARKIFTEHGWH